MNISNIEVVIHIDDEEQISLRDFGYLDDNDFDDEAKVCEAIHSVIADLWKMNSK